MSWRKLGGIALIAFAVYFLVRSPVESATAIKAVSKWIGTTSSNVATALTTFLQTLF